MPAGYHLTTSGRLMRPPLGRTQSAPKARRLSGLSGVRSGVGSGVGSGVTTPRGETPRFTRSNRNSGRNTPRGGPTTPRGHFVVQKTCARPLPCVGALFARSLLGGREDVGRGSLRSGQGAMAR